MKKNTNSSNITFENNVNIINSQNSQSFLEHTIEISTMDQFRNLTKEKAKNFKNVIFTKMEINEEFVDKFWELFLNGLNRLELIDCHLTSGYKFKDLFDGDYSISYLIIKSNDLSMDDVDHIFSLIYPHLIRKFVFYSNQLNIDVVKNTLIKRLGSCAPELEVFNNIS